MSTSSATWYGASGSFPSVSSMIGLPVSAVAPDGLKARPGGPLPPTTFPSEPITKTVCSAICGCADPTSGSASSWSTTLPGMVRESCTASKSLAPS